MVTDAPIEIFDRQRLKHNRGRAAKKSADYSFLSEWATKEITARLQDITREFENGMLMSPTHTSNNDEHHTFSLGYELCKIKNLFKMDLSGLNNQTGTIIGDEEFLPFKNESLDLIISILNLHSTNDLPGTLVQIKRALKPDGFFIAALFGGETLHELRQSLMQTELSLKGGASPRIFPFADKQQMGALMQRAGFALPVVDSEILTVTYDNMFDLMKDLRFMGEGNIIKDRSKIYPGKSFFMKAAQYYQENFSDDDGRIRASFEIIFLGGWSPHDSQQKPLRPGSAETRLADALATDEIKTGEIATP